MRDLLKVTFLFWITCFTTGARSHRTMHVVVYEPKRNSEHAARESKNRAYVY